MESMVRGQVIPLRITSAGDSSLQHNTMMITLFGGIVVGMVVGGVLGSVLSDSEWVSFLGVIIGLIVGLPVLVSVVRGIVSIFNTWLRGTPRWFEFSDHFAYASKRTVHDLQWREVKSIAFTYEQGYIDPEADLPADYEPREATYATYLEVSFASEQPLRIMTDEGCKASLHAERIVQTLVRGLASADPAIRKRCAEGLGRMPVSGARLSVPYPCVWPRPRGKEGGSIRAHMGRFVWDDAAGVVERLRRAESDLRTAVADQDEGVRTAATAALKRITSP